MSSTEYIGRFAPSPTGLLHMGSLMTAMASYCDAKAKYGQWLVRIEDLDPPREISGASKNILETLTKYGFHFNKEVIYQSHKERQNAYELALQKLIKKGVVYFCSCSRKKLKLTTLHDHSCRNSSHTPQKEFSCKIKVPDQIFSFKDTIQGHYAKNIQHDFGDFIIKRKDQLFAYQIAVVVDDNFQRITNIVRGIDLIDSTPWQIYLNALLGYKQPTYSHLPILVNEKNQKLSKQTFAKEIDHQNIIQTLITAYSYLNQKPLLQKPQSIKDFWKQAINNWNINNIAKIESIKV